MVQGWCLKFEGYFALIRLNHFVDSLDPRRKGSSPVGPVGGVVSPGARDEGLAGIVGGFTDERR